MEARTITNEITVFPSFAEAPGMGFVPVNSFVLKAAQPVLVDTGLYADHEAFMQSLPSVIDPQDLRWLWLTHPDADHIGSLKALMAEAPNLRLVTSYIGYAILSLSDNAPALDRVYFINPGESLNVGDRDLVAVKPPTFDNPATTGFFDPKSRAFFSSDSFGALVPELTAYAEDLPHDALFGGQQLWAKIDSPWVHQADTAKFGASLKAIESLDPSWLLSSHLPPTSTMFGEFLVSLATLPESEPVSLPNQAALEAMLAAMTQGNPA